MPTLLHDLLDRAVASSPGKEALVDGERRVTFQEMSDMASHLGRVFVELGLGRRDRVAVWLDKSVEEAVSFFAISAAGGVTVPINVLLMERQVRHILDDCGVAIVLTSASRFEAHREMLKAVDSLKVIVVVDAAEHTDGDVVDRVFEREAKSTLPVRRQIGEDLAAIIYTSGSTGRPKGVMLSHRNLLSGSRIVCDYLGITAAERILSVLPFSFDAGLNQLFTAVEKTATLVLCRFTFGEEIVREIRRERCTALAGVPTIWAILAGSAPSLKSGPLESMRYFTNTGGPIPTKTLQRIREAQPHVDFYLMYGLTEAFRSTYLPPEEADKRPTSIGKAIPECEILIVSEDGTQCGVREEGILVHRGPTVFLGYWNRPEDTKRVLRPNPIVPKEHGGELVCFSGDRVWMDEEGYLYFVARNDAMIKSSGYRISPAEIEEVVVGSGYVAECAVVGLPDASVGERVHAICVPLEGVTFDEALVLEHCAKELPRHMLPRSVEVAEHLPRSPNGKVDYRQLKSARVSES